MLDRIACPRCQRPLARSGELSVAGQVVALAVFQCDECLAEMTYDGARFPVAFTFAVDAAGRLLNAETLEPLQPPTG